MKKPRHGMGKVVDGKRGSFYNRWRNMRHRCRSVKEYTERGIQVDLRWAEFAQFRDDMYESYLKHVAEHGVYQTQLDRIDNDKGYSPENCRWATRVVNQSNRRNTVLLTVDGETKTQQAWARTKGINPALIITRLKAGWSAEDAVNRPSHYGKSYSKIRRRCRHTKVH